MKYNIFFALLFVLTSCGTQEHLTKVKCKLIKPQKPVISVPSDFHLQIFEGGNESTRYRFMYSDSAIIYLSNETNGALNHENIKFSGRNEELNYAEWKGDVPMLIYGVDKSGKYWKHFLTDRHFSVGYLHVSKSRQKLFDETIQKFIGNRDTSTFFKASNILDLVK